MHKNCTIYFSVTCSFIGDRWFVNRIHLSGLRVEALEISFIGDRWFVKIHLSGLRVEALDISFIGDRWFINRIRLSGLRVEALEDQVLVLWVCRVGYHIASTCPLICGMG